MKFLPFDPLGSQQRLYQWALKEEDRGARFPTHSQHQFFYLLDIITMKQSNSPRVVGLLVNNETKSGEPVGLVTPLKARRSENGWQIGHSLPFHAGHIQDALFNLLKESGQQIKDKVPELVAFEISENLKEPANGTSMHVSGLLAIIDVLNDCKANIFESACTVVEIDKDKMIAVGGIKAKLEAFVREYQHGSLLVRHSECGEAAQFDEYFDHVWAVSNLAELGAKLLEFGLMEKVLESFPINLATVASAKHRVEWFRQQRKEPEALEFVERLDSANRQGKKPLLRVDQQIKTLLEDLNRNVGRSFQAIVHSRDAVKSIEKLGPLSSFNELLDAQVRLAAALYDGHDFQAAVELLGPLISEVNSNENLVTAESQIMLYNTFGRLKVILGHDDWEKWFQKSVELQEVVDPNSVPRTYSYIIHGLLRSNQIDRVEEYIDAVNGQDDFTDAFLTFFKADKARRIGRETWDDGQFESKASNYVHGFYYQATARQAGRSTEDAANRFTKAADAMNPDNTDPSDENILQLFALFSSLGAAVAKADETNREHSLERINQFLSQPEANSIQIWYQGKIPKSPRHILELDDLFNAVPYF